MGNVIMKAQQIVYGASNVEKALDDLKAPELIELNKRMAAIDEWKADVHEVTYIGPELTINNALALPARSLITEINAIQDLHGYGKPWAGGAGKNKLPTILSAIKANNTHGTWSGNSFTYEGITATVNTDSVGNITGFSCNGTSSNVFYFNIGAYGFVSGTDVCMSGGKSADKYLVVQGLSSLKDTGSGLAINTVNETKWIQLVILSGQTCPNEVFYPQIEIGTQATAFAPYSNICPISGRTAAVVERTSANYVTDYLNGSNIIADGSIVSNEQYSLALLPIKQGETYTASHNTESYWVWAFYRSKPAIGSVSYNNDRTLDVISTSKTFTSPIDGYIAIRVPVAYRELMVNGGSTALPYEPSYATDFTIQLGTTVYGAEINWDTGVATLTHAFIIYDGSSDEEWSASVAGSGAGYRCRIDTPTGVKIPSNNGETANIICNQFKAKTANQTYLGNEGISIQNGGGNPLDVYSVSFNTSDISLWKTYLSNNPLQVCYELATPQILQLTPEQLEMLKGYNRITLVDGYGTIELKALVLGGDN